MDPMAQFSTGVLPMKAENSTDSSICPLRSLLGLQLNLFEFAVTACVRRSARLDHFSVYIIPVPETSHLPT